MTDHLHVQANGRSASNGTNSTVLSKGAVEAEAVRHSTSTAPATAWDSPGPASFDFRSDTITTPTASMLQSIAGTTLLDDVFFEDPATNNLQHFAAELCQHEDALLVTSGTQGNQLALRASLDCAPPYSIVVDSRSHICCWEAGGAGWLAHALVRPVTPRNGHHFTLEDVQEHTILSDEIHGAPTRLVCLENTLAGTVMPLTEIARISAWCRAHAVHLHCDGARLWEAVAAAVSQAHLPPADQRAALVAELARHTTQCDSVSLCFSKGLGAPIGSVLVGSRAFIKRARHLRKAMGGGMRQAGILAAPARVAVEETFLGGRLALTHARAREVARIWEHVAGGRLEEGKETETNMVWCDLASVGTDVEGFVRACQDEGLRVMGGRLVVHYQIGEDAMARWHKVCERLAVDGRTQGDDDAHGMGPESKRLKLDVE